MVWVSVWCLFGACLVSVRRLFGCLPVASGNIVSLVPYPRILIIISSHYAPSLPSLQLPLHANTVITTDQAKLVDLVQLLGEYLVDESAKTRQTAIQCISDVLKDLPTDKLTKQQLTVISEFLSERLADEPVTGQVLDGMNAVVTMSAISSLSVKKIVDSLVGYYLPSSHVQVVRYKAYVLLRYLTENKSQSLKSTASAQEGFIKCFLTCTNGEKDPRNLLESFAINEWISNNLTVPENDVEPQFDATFCYFPITFRPPKNDPYKITADQLKVALRTALAAGKQYSKLIFPALLEKLTSSSLSVKGDTLDTIAACIANYGPEITAENWKDIWDGTKFEVLHGSEPELAGKTLTVLKRLAEELQKHGDQSQLDEYLTNVETDCMDKLKDPTNRLSTQAAQIVASVSLAGVDVAKKLTTPALSAILAVTDTQIPTLTSICEILLIFLKSSLPNVTSTPLFEFKDRVFDVLAKALLSSPESESSLRILAIKGFSAAVNITEFLSQTDTELIVRYLDDVIVNDTNTKTLQAAVDALVLIAEKPGNAGIIQNITFPALLSELPASDSDKEAKTRILFLLSVLAKVSTSKTLIEVLQVRILSHMDTVTGSTALYPTLLLQTLLSALKEQESKDYFDTTSYLKSTFPRLFKTAFDASYSGSPAVMATPQVTEAAGRILTSITRHCTVQDQVLTSLFSLFFNGTTSDIFPSATLPEKQKFNVLDTPLPCMSLLTSCFAPLSRDLELPKLHDPFVLLRSVISTVSGTADPAIRRHYLRFAGLLTNKWINTAASPQAVAFVTDLLETATPDALESAAWIIKGWLLKNDSTAFKFVDTLVGMLPGANGLVAAKSFDILLGDDELFVKQNSVVIRQLYKQRLFVSVVPKLVQGYKDVDDKVPYVVALSNIVNSVPSSIVSPALESIMSLVVDSLSVSEARVKTAGIDTILATIGQTDIVASYLDELVPSLLDAAFSSPAVSIKALQCLGAFASTVDLPKIVPFKQRIINSLTPLLDHKKRDVRRACVDTRQAYFELGINK